MAGGDQAAVFTLYLEFGDHVAALMRRELRRLGVQHVEPDELDGLVLDGCLASRTERGLRGTPRAARCRGTGR